MTAFVYTGLSVLMIGIFLCLRRVASGPTAPDRTVAIEIIGIILVGFCTLLSIHTGEDFYMSVAIGWALLSFIGSLALGKYLEGREFDE